MMHLLSSWPNSCSYFQGAPYEINSPQEPITGSEAVRHFINYKSFIGLPGLWALRRSCRHVGNTNFPWSWLISFRLSTVFPKHFGTSRDHKPGSWRTLHLAFQTCQRSGLQGYRLLANMDFIPTFVWPIWGPTGRILRKQSWLHLSHGKKLIAGINMNDIAAFPFRSLNTTFSLCNSQNNINNEAYRHPSFVDNDPSFCSGPRPVYSRLRRKLHKDCSCGCQLHWDCFRLHM